MNFGTIFDTAAPHTGLGSMKIAGTVGAELAIARGDNTYTLSRITTPVIDNTKMFQEAVTFKHGSLLLEGGFVVDSLSHRNSTVLLFHGNTVVIETFKVVGAPNTQPGNVGSSVLNFTDAAVNLDVQWRSSEQAVRLEVARLCLETLA